jgi:hypothetical protein
VHGWDEARYQSLALPEVAYSAIDFCDVYASPDTPAMAAAIAAPRVRCTASSGESAFVQPYGRRISWPLCPPAHAVFSRTHTPRAHTHRERHGYKQDAHAYGRMGAPMCACVSVGVCVWLCACAGARWAIPAAAWVGPYVFLHAPLWPSLVPLSLCVCAWLSGCVRIDSPRMKIDGADDAAGRHEKILRRRHLPMPPLSHHSMLLHTPPTHIHTQSGTGWAFVRTSGSEAGPVPW